MATIAIGSASVWERISQWGRQAAAQPAVRLGGVVWLGSRLLYAALSVILTVGLTPRAPHGAGDILWRWGFWDGGWYAWIANVGYARPTWPVFFPLLPLGEHVLHALLPVMPGRVAGLLLSNVAALVAFIALADLARWAIGARRAAVAVALFAASPFAFWLAAAYSDSLALAAAVVALVCARRRWWSGAIIAGVLLGLARPVGIVLVAPLLALLWDARPRWWVALVAIAPLIGTSLYSLYLWRAVGDPLAWVHAQTLFGRVGFAGFSGVPLAARQFAAAAPGMRLRLVADFAPIVIAITLAPLVWRRVGAWAGFLVGGVLLLTLLTPTTVAVTPDAYPAAGRYLLLAFPLLWPLLPANRWALAALWLGGWTLQVLLLAYLWQGGWLV